jgi:hypothetical protein
MSADTMRQRLTEITENLLPSDYSIVARAVRAAQKLMMEMKPPSPPTDAHPFTSGEISESWITGTVDLEANAQRLDKRRGVLLTLVRDGRSQCQSMRASTHRHVLHAFNAELEALLDEVRKVSDELGDVDTATKAITNDHGAQWKRLAELADEYDELRSAQRQLMDSDVIHAATPEQPGDPHASDLCLSNLDAIWPEWRRGGPDGRTVNLGTHSALRHEPWPADPVEFLIWLVRSEAQPWIPDEHQLEELRQDRIARANPLPKGTPGRPDKPRTLNTTITL